MPALRIFLRGDHLLDFEEEFVADDPWDAIFLANIAVDVDAAVSLVGKYLLETRPPPRAIVRGFDAPGVQTAHDVKQKDRQRRRG